MNNRITLPLLKKMAILSLVILLSFLVYWNIDNYNKAKVDLEQKLLDQMELACSEYRDSVVQFIFRTVDTDNSSSAKDGFPGELYLKASNQKKGQGQHNFGLRIDSVKSASFESLRVYHFDSIGSNDHFGSDDIVAWTKGNSGRFNLDFESHSDTVITISADHSFFGLAEHHKPKVSKTYQLIDTIYRNKLLKNNLPINYEVTFDSINTQAHIDVRFAYATFGSSSAPFASFSNTSRYLLRMIISPLLISLFLFSLIGLSFFLVFRNIKSRQRLTDIKNDFISNMTHELKTPIATVGVAIEAMEHFGAAEDPAKQKEYLDICKHEVERLSTLVNKVMRLSFNDHAEQEITKQDVDIRGLLHDTVGHMKLLFDRKRIRYKENIEGDNFIMSADKLHLTNVVYNLLDNAIKYSEEDTLVTVSLMSSPKKFELRIRDQGIGINRSYQSKVFDRFFRVPNDNVHNTKGHGLGLHYVKSIINAHGGQIRLESHPGEGTLFVVTLPR